MVLSNRVVDAFGLEVEGDPKVKGRFLLKMATRLQVCFGFGWTRYQVELKGAKI